VILTVAVLGSGCALLTTPLPPVVGGGGATLPCGVAAVRSCALPFPSDEFTVADPMSGTGRRLRIPERVVPERLTAQLGPGAAPTDVSRGADGYASLSPVMFELDRAVDPSTLPADGGDALAVFDAATGRRVPIRAVVPGDAARHGAPDTIVAAWPVLRFESGRSYVARITTALRPRSGGTFTKPAGLLGDSETSRALRGALRRAEGDRWPEVVSATRFTVRSKRNATADLDRMAAIARAQDHPVRNLRVDPAWLIPAAGAVVTGEVGVSDFRDRHGVARPEHGARNHWVKFLLVLPRQPAGPDGAPVAIYGHGLTAAKETMVVTANTNAELGVATIGIDVPNHGDRQSAADGGHLLELTTPRGLGRMASMTVQGVIDQVSLLTAVRTHIGTLELVLADLPWRAGGPAPRVDTSRILYQGTSMGGVLGVAFTALAPELRGSFVQVAGTGISDIIYNSVLWPLFMRTVPEGASTGDAYGLMAAATMLMDRGDHVNLLDRIRPNGTPVFLAYGVNDGIVPNRSSERLLRLLGLPLVGPQLAPLVPAPVRADADSPPADGWGVAQVWSSAPMEMQSLGGHVSFAEPRAQRLLREWMVGRLAASGIDVGAR
jgi:hypothetical protein